MPVTIEPPVFWDGEPSEHIRKVALAVRQMLEGKTNNYFDVTLEPDATQTIVERERVNIDTKVSLTPQSASAAAAITFLWVEVSYGRITVHHDSQPDSDRSFAATVIG